MWILILQNLAIAISIAIIGVISSRLLKKMSQAIRIKLLSNLLDEIVSDCRRGLITISIVYFCSTTAVILTPLRPSFIVKNILTGIALIVCSGFITFGTLVKETVTDYYEFKANLSEKDKSITLTLIPIIASILRYLNISSTALIVLSIWGVNIAPVLSGTAVVLAVFGFAGQAILQDLLGFSSLIIDRPYYVGSEIEFIFDCHIERGVVKEITLRNTVLKHSDGYLFYIPNRDAKNFRVWKR